MSVLSQEIQTECCRHSSVTWEIYLGVVLGMISPVGSRNRRPVESMILI